MGPRPSSWRLAAVELGPHPSQHVTVAVSDGDHEVETEEERDLGDVDDLLVVDVADRLEHHEHHAVVHLELGPLVCRHRVLDRQRRQPELLGDDGDLLRGGLLQPDPHETGRGAGHLSRLVQRHPARPAAAVLVDAAVADHRVDPTPVGAIHNGFLTPGIVATGGGAASQQTPGPARTPRTAGKLVNRHAASSGSEFHSSPNCTSGRTSRSRGIHRCGVRSMRRAPIPAAHLPRGPCCLGLRPTCFPAAENRGLVRTVSECRYRRRCRRRRSSLLLRGRPSVRTTFRLRRSRRSHQG